MVTDTSLSFEERRELGIQTMYYITLEPDRDTRFWRFWKMGRFLLEKYSGAALENCGQLQLDQWTDDEFEAWMTAAPDPDVPGGSFVLCQVAIYRETPATADGDDPSDRYSVITQGLLSAFEAFVRRRGGSVRGAMLFLDPNGHYLGCYFDGKRWISIHFFEFQKPQDVGHL
ncbi:hypothetical protein F4774DRAFT_384660 [Daldinia eschscholtzii]|nr:hypothetical protein F4774DRAFT_384660 [Daldinia eschscholtzii]